MSQFSQAFKVQSVKKALSRDPSQTLKQLADELSIGYSTLQRWIRLATNNKLENVAPLMSKEKNPQAWTQIQRLEAILDCHGISEEEMSAYCREHGIYPHHIKEWKVDLLKVNHSSESASKQEKRKLKQEVNRLQKELNRKDKALAETAALLVLSKKCQAIWGEKEVE
jgi:transposase-like protein